MRQFQMMYMVSEGVDDFKELDMATKQDFFRTWRDYSANELAA